MSYWQNKVAIGRWVFRLGAGIAKKLYAAVGRPFKSPPGTPTGSRRRRRSAGRGHRG